MVGGAPWCGLRPLEAMLPQSSPDGGRRWWPPLGRSPICDCLGRNRVLLQNKSFKTCFRPFCQSPLLLVGRGGWLFGFATKKIKLVLGF